jgi:DNA-3-methyladenine glycosylase I
MSDELTRCTWCLKDEAYIKYHDEAWGIPIHDDNVHFEYLALEAAQAGLSWHTILIRMEGYRIAFSNWDIDKIENYDNDKVLELLQFEGIIRNRKKIEAVIHNVKPFKKIQKEFGSFDNYIWAYVNSKPLINEIKTVADYAASTPLSDQISKDLKNRGFKFIGTTTTYAYMQAIGLVNDHMESCWKK